MEKEKLAESSNDDGKQSIYHSPIRSVFNKFSHSKDASLVYGEPIDLDSKRVLPVAKVNYYVGGSGGYSAKNENELAVQGEGAGGFFSIKLVGVFEITPKKVKFKPIINIYFILTVCSVVTHGLGFLLKKSRKLN
ncbi:hypothetical protein [Psychrobacillus vulpis]|uniref:Sporulation protein YtfJ n=1 Tax=Psychrobacillus vulpis TaxID=2325572 RepID=A0A544TW13_9BACI|nr:hypothetical protein [Psychrobacillus vulpis]TQR21636.1 hypothetical protein FG384_01390 [Psychrobacillus vulpis]